jgi:hypothetical protein
MNLRWRDIVSVAIVVVLGALLGPAVPRWSRCAAGSGTEIFSGIVYGCEVLPVSAEGRGILQWVRIDLSAPGIELYLTPLDPTAVQQGWQYRLAWIEDVVRNERLAVAINGTMFDSTSGWQIRLPGELAKTAEMVVADHVPAVGQFWQADYLLWFDDRLTPHLTDARPPPPSDIEKAAWGISGGTFGLRAGQVWPETERRPDARTAAAIDRERNLLFLAVADWISPHRLFVELARLGVKDAILLDGGGSSAMALGSGAPLESMSVQLGSRPVATYLGVRARPLTRPAQDGGIIRHAPAL